MRLDETGRPGGSKAIQRERERERERMCESGSLVQGTPAVYSFFPLHCTSHTHAPLSLNQRNQGRENVSESVRACQRRSERAIVCECVSVSQSVCEGDLAHFAFPAAAVCVSRARERHTHRVHSRLRDCGCKGTGKRATERQRLQVGRRGARAADNSGRATGDRSNHSSQ